MKIWAHIPQVMNEPGDKTTFMKATFGTVFICDFALPHGPHPCMHPSFESSSGKFIRWNTNCSSFAYSSENLLTLQYIVSSRKNWKATCIRRSVWVFPTLHYITLHYTTLPYVMYTEFHYITLNYTTLRYIALQCFELHWVALRYTTLRCVTQQNIASHCSSSEIAVHCVHYTWHD